MTSVGTTLRSAYLAGPMRGYEEYNFPLFRKAAKWLRKQGWKIESPHERDEAEGFDPKNDEAQGLDYYMQFDLAMVARTDAVITLPGWESSQGARLEAMVAVELGHPVFEITGPNGLRIAEEGDPKKAKWQVTSVEPQYVKAIYATESMGLFENDPEPEREHELSKDCWCEPRAEWVPAADYGVELGVEGDSFTGETRTLPTDSAGRKAVPITSGVLDYFPAALVEVARVSKAGNDKHNPGQPLHHARGKSTDHADSLLRHMIDRGKVDPDTGCRHSAEVAWRALAMLQQELEDEGLAELPRGAVAPQRTMPLNADGTPDAYDMFRVDEVMQVVGTVVGAVIEDDTVFPVDTVLAALDRGMDAVRAERNNREQEEDLG